MRFLAAVCFVPMILFWLAPLCPAADDLEDSRRRLNELEQRISETSKNLEKKRDSARTLAADLEAVSKEEDRLRRRVAALTQETVVMEERLVAKTAEMEELKGRIDGTEGHVRKRLNALYKGGEIGPLRLLFAAVSPARAAEDQDFLRRIVRLDRELLADYRRQLTQREEVSRQLKELHGRRQAALQDLRQDQATLRQAVRLKKDLLARVRRDENELNRELAGLREGAQRLGALVKKLESAKPRAYTQLDGSFAKQQGRLRWPVDGRVRLGFGLSRHPELGTLHESQGIEIAIDGQQPIAAIWPGRVLFANWFKGYGQLLILDHGDGYYSLYAQASRLTRKVGDQVGGGEVLAFSGAEGARGIYFEIRHHGIPLDPAAWLAAR